jgi:hypothetical protein
MPFFSWMFALFRGESTRLTAPPHKTRVGVEVVSTFPSFQVF